MTSSLATALSESVFCIKNNKWKMISLPDKCVHFRLLFVHYADGIKYRIANYLWHIALATLLQYLAFVRQCIILKFCFAISGGARGKQKEQSEFCLQSKHVNHVEIRRT